MKKNGQQKINNGLKNLVAAPFIPQFGVYAKSDPWELIHYISVRRKMSFVYPFLCTFVCSLT